MRTAHKQEAKNVTMCLTGSDPTVGMQVFKVLLLSFTRGEAKDGNKYTTQSRSGVKNNLLLQLFPIVWFLDVCVFVHFPWLEDVDSRTAPIRITGNRIGRQSCIVARNSTSAFEEKQYEPSTLAYENTWRR